MRFAAIADIHGNALALEAVLDDIARQGVDGIVNVGDCLSGPLEEALPPDRLLALDGLHIRGHHDRYLVDLPADRMPPWEQDCFSELSTSHLQWLKSLPFSAVWREAAYCCHATPKDDNSYWLEAVHENGAVGLRPLAQIEALAEGIPQSLILCGHSHIPRAVRLRDGRMIVNPGSVGAPAYDDDAPFYHRMETGTPQASYAIIEGEAWNWSVSFRLVAYDHLAASAKAAAKGRADWASALATGWLPDSA